MLLTHMRGVAWVGRPCEDVGRRHGGLVPKKEVAGWRLAAGGWWLVAGGWWHSSATNQLLGRLAARHRTLPGPCAVPARAPCESTSSGLSTSNLQIFPIPATDKMNRLVINPPSSPLQENRQWRTGLYVSLSRIVQAKLPSFSPSIKCHRSPCPLPPPPRKLP